MRLKRSLRSRRLGMAFHAPGEKKLTKGKWKEGMASNVQSTCDLIRFHLYCYEVVGTDLNGKNTHKIKGNKLD